MTADDPPLVDVRGWLRKAADDLRDAEIQCVALDPSLEPLCRTAEALRKARFST